MSLARSTNDPRRIPRETVDCPIRIWGATLAPMAATLVNLSPQGCMVRCDQMVSTGETLTIDIPAGATLRGRVVWARDGRIGMALDMPLLVDDFLDMLHEVEARAPEARIAP
jgi:hypothetical protein